MAQLRNNHPALRMNSWTLINQNVQSSSPTNGVLVTQINGAAVNDSWQRIIVIYNSGSDYTVNLPSGSWNLIMSGGNPPSAKAISLSNSVVAAGTAVTILYQ